MHQRLAVIALILPMLGARQAGSPPAHMALPSPQQQAWQDLVVGMFIHFAPNTWQDRENDDLSRPLASIDPEKLDTDQWVDTAVSMGARYIAFVAGKPEKEVSDDMVNGQTPVPQE